QQESRIQSAERRLCVHSNHLPLSNFEGLAGPFVPGYYAVGLPLRSASSADFESLRKSHDLVTIGYSKNMLQFPESPLQLALESPQNWKLARDRVNPAGSSNQCPAVFYLISMLDPAG